LPRQEVGARDVFYEFSGKIAAAFSLKIFEPSYRFPANFQARCGVNPIKQPNPPRQAAIRRLLAPLAT